MFSAEEYQRRRQALANSLGEGVIILPSYANSTMSNDVFYEFRQQSDFLYFTGFPEPDSIAILEVEDGKITYTLFVPERDETFEIWNGRRYGTEGAISTFHADAAYNNTDFELKLADILKKYEHVYWTQGENQKVDATITEKMLEASKSRDKTGRGPIFSTNCIYQIHELRVKKSAEEIEVMKKSADISAKAMELGIKVSMPGMKEAEVEAVIEYYYAKHGAQRPAYPTIAGSGVNATILHYIENIDELNEGELMLVDAGAEYQGYASDITRTWPVNAKFSDAQKEVYQLVLDTQEACILMVKPGITIQELHDTAVELITEGLVDLGLLEGAIDEIIEEKKYSRFFMHGLGHFLGMDVHDTSLLGRKYILQEGNYFTVEPGIYIPDEDDIPERYRGIGVRIEDDVLVTTDGCEVLSDGVAKSIEDIENLVGTATLP